MKSKLFAIELILIALSISALAYTIWNIGRTPKSEVAEPQDSGSLSDSNHEKNLDWLNQIQGVQQTTSTRQATSTEEIAHATSTVPETQGTASSTSSSQKSDNEPSIEDLGNGDALQSTTYDLASQSLSLSAKIKNGSVVLSWTPTKSSGFATYHILRSTTNPNVNPDNTTPLRSIADKSANAYQDVSAQNDTTYYYRICFQKTSGKPGCGNILAVRF